ncbi:primosomal protein [Rhodococcus sp. IEGM 1401]|uniref:primosomal protein n=1 Tax=unclassified Rhodococcus (in: high G+C Gram-positive bacteria) TaxID=192944 RepID=UPI0022B3951F|nr:MULTISPECIES: primosomal protein [unclassified Rhodococcus (in: high G+C Gram-positive bacteria)]MCZ4559247.1 primosomal protein [Rhodococcus sp. IEGM 1401]MDI6630412.1 primosomal protein [Rhodococcus sp. (in: high G+C Gram-positive bacteria)]MDI9919800.1 primosomal protein [Rhodococcus sp. IEGM 1372]MDV8031826.1 primosomal protein [Rhodococcus sp. IEGM 1414]
MAGDIIPIELGLTAGDFSTLWAPEWREGDDEWEAFLGHEEDLYGFSTVAELAAFVRSDDDNDLVDHPSWKVVSALAAHELEPDDLHRFDLVAVPELVASDPEADVLAELQATFDIVSSIGDVCELRPVTSFFGSNPFVGAVGGGVENFLGREGGELWDRIGAAVAKHWDDVLDAVDSIVTSPDVDSAAVAVAEAEITAAAENAVDADDVTDDIDSDSDDDDEDDDSAEVDRDPIAAAAAEDTFWTTVGIDPIRIITSDDTLYTLRCYLGDKPVFLGRGGAISVFGSERSLARYLADDHDHDLAQVSTYSDVQTAAIDGSLDIEITDDNVYVLPGLADDLAEGPTAVDVEQLDLAVELFTDAADFAGDASVDEALATSTPLGWYVSYALEPSPDRLAPSAPFDVEAEAWRALEREFESRLRKK